MARPLRIEYPGALYHVCSRGDNRARIFRDDRDRTAFLEWLRHAIETHNLICHAYCLMNNHYHLLIETPDVNLSQAMRDLNGNYTQWFNAKYRRVGHLFQGRYKSFVIEKELYLLAVARYIVLNPVRAKFVDHPRAYRWSSYRYTAEAKNPPIWLSTDWVLGFFGKDRLFARPQYRRFVMEGIGTPDPHEDAQHGFLLGSQQFIHWIWDSQTKGTEALKEYPREQRIVGRPTLETLFEEVRGLEERDAAIRMAKQRCGYLNTEIARHLKLHPSTVGKIANGMYNAKQSRI